MTELIFPGTVEEVEAADLDLESDLDLGLGQWLEELSGVGDCDARSAAPERVTTAAVHVLDVLQMNITHRQQQQALLHVPSCHTTSTSAPETVIAASHHGHKHNGSAAAAAAAFVASCIPEDSSSSGIEAVCPYPDAPGPTHNGVMPNYRASADVCQMQAQFQMGGHAPPKPCHQQQSSSSSNAELGMLDPDLGPMTAWPMPPAAPHQPSLTRTRAATPAVQVPPVHREHLSGSSPELSTRSAASGFMNNGCMHHVPTGSLCLPARHQKSLQQFPGYAAAPTAETEAVVVGFSGERADAATGTGSKPHSYTAGQMVHSGIWPQGVAAAARQPDLVHRRTSDPATGCRLSAILLQAAPPAGITMASQGYAEVSQQHHPGHSHFQGCAALSQQHHPAPSHFQGCLPSYQAGLNASPGCSLDGSVYPDGNLADPITGFTPAQHITLEGSWPQMHSSLEDCVPMRMGARAPPGGVYLPDARDGFDPQWDHTLHSHEDLGHGGMLHVKQESTRVAAQHTAAAADGTLQQHTLAIKQESGLTGATGPAPSNAAAQHTAAAADVTLQQHTLAIKHEAGLTGAEVPGLSSPTGRCFSSQVHGAGTFQQQQPPCSAGVLHDHLVHGISPSPHSQQHSYSHLDTIQYALAAADALPSSLPTVAAAGFSDVSGTSFAAAVGGVPELGVALADAEAETTGSVEDGSLGRKHCQQDMNPGEINPLALYVHPLLAPLFEGLDPQDAMIPKSVRRSVGRPSKADRFLNYAGEDFAAQLRLERRQEPQQHHHRCRCGRPRLVGPAAKKQQGKAPARPRQEVSATRGERLAKRHQLAVTACSEIELQTAVPPSGEHTLATARLLPAVASGGVLDYAASPWTTSAAFTDTTSIIPVPAVPALAAMDSSITSQTAPAVFTSTTGSSIASHTTPACLVDHSSMVPPGVPAACERAHYAQQVVAAPWLCNAAQPYNQPCLGVWQQPATWPTAAFQASTPMASATLYDASAGLPSAAALANAAVTSTAGSQFRDDKTFQALVKTGFFPTGTFLFQVGPTNVIVPASVLPTGFIFWAGSGQQYPSPSRFSLAVLQSLHPGYKSSNGWQDIKLSGVELGAWRDAFITKRPRPAISADCILQH